MIDPPDISNLSSTAKRLLLAHKPDTPAYLSWALGPVRDEAGLKAIDVAYAELVAGGMVEPIEMIVSVLPGARRTPFVLTQAGERAREK